MPGPGPRGPCKTYRTPCSSILDPRILARNPRKTGKSRRARGTRARQPGTRSTRDGLLCGEIASAAGGTRARAARTAPAAERNPAHGPRSSSSSPASSPAIDHQLDERRPFVCQTGIQTPGPELEQLEQQLTGPRRSISRRSSRHWFPGSDPPASIPEDSLQMPGSSSWHPGSAFRGPGISGHFASKNNQLPAIAARGPGSVPAGAWAMFLTNNPVKNDMNVSRETLPNF